MNERIKLLAEQSGFNVDFTPSDDETERGYQVVSNDFAEKFAELIVQECIGVVENLPAGYRDYRDQIEDAFRRDCVEKIKQHFGVEE